MTSQDWQSRKIIQMKPMQHPMPVAGFGDDGHIPPMNERLGKLEGQMEGVKHGQNMLLGGLGLVGAIIILLVTLGLGVGIYELQRIDQLSDKIGALPGQINSDLRDITKTLAQSISAAKQVPPQVIIMPAPPVKSERGESGGGGATGDMAKPPK
jgi:hypothetical protein